jgi:hypothetical protein
MADQIAADETGTPSNGHALYRLGTHRNRPFSNSILAAIPARTSHCITFSLNVYDPQDPDLRNLESKEGVGAQPAAVLDFEMAKLNGDQVDLTKEYAGRAWWSIGSNHVHDRATRRSFKRLSESW